MTSKSEDRRLDELLAQAGWLDRLARRLVHDPSEADDVVQETWVAALRDKSRAHSVRGWLAQIARNVVLQRGRGETARRQREHSVARAEASEAESEAFERAQSQKRLVDAVLALDEPYRSSVILHYFDHLEVAEVARKLGVPESTVRTRLSRALAEMRARFQKKDGTDWALAFLPLASPKAGVAATPLIVGGTLVATSWKIAAGVALVATLAWFAWPSPKGLDAPSNPLQAGAELAQPLEAPALEQHASAESRAPLDAVPAPKAPAPGSELATLDVHVRWGDDGTDASDIGLELWMGNAVDPFHDRRDGHTDARGHAHFQDLAPGYVAIEMDRADIGCSLEPDQRATLEIAIPDGIDVHGIVVDEDGNPAPGATIWLSEYANGTEGTDVTTSGPDGRFYVRDVGPSRSVGAHREGYGPSPLEDLPAASPGQRVETRLVLARESAEVAGLVRDVAGQPIAAAMVRLAGTSRYARGPEGRMQNLCIAPVIVKTDANGAFQVRGLAVSWTRIIAHAPGFAPASRDENLAPGQKDVDITLARMAVVHGRVVDAQSVGVNSAGVGYGEYGGAASAHTSTRADGSFRLVGLPSGSVKVRVGGEGKGSLERTFDLKPGDDVEWQVQLVARPSVSGRVLDAEGKPAAGFMVGAIRPEQPGGFLRNTKTDAEGRFQLDDWPAEASAIEVREDGAWVGLPAALLEPVKAGTGEELVIRLAADALRSAWVTGRVLDENGKPVEVAEVYCFVEGSGQGTSVTTDSDGRFRYGPLRPGRYFLQVQVKGYALCFARGLALAADETKDVGDLRLERPGEISLRLRLPEGFDVGRAEGHMLLIAPDGSRDNWMEVHAGAGDLGGLAPGRYELRLSCQWLRAAPMEVVVLARETSRVELVAFTGTERLVRISPPHDAQGTRVHVRVFDAAGALVYEDEFAFRTRQPLVFSAPGLVVGSYTVEASTKDGHRASGTVEVRSLEPVNSMLELAL